MQHPNPSQTTMKDRFQNHFGLGTSSSFQSFASCVERQRGKPCQELFCCNMWVSSCAIILTHPFKSKALMRMCCRTSSDVIWGSTAKDRNSTGSDPSHFWKTWEKNSTLVIKQYLHSNLTLYNIYYINDTDVDNVLSQFHYYNELRWTETEGRNRSQVETTAKLLLHKVL